MHKPARSKTKVEFGDFQTPVAFSYRVCQLLKKQGIFPASVLEPTCGRGNFLLAALETFGETQKGVGAEVNPDYLLTARTRIEKEGWTSKVQLIHANFFSFGWESLLASLPHPVLVIGNPPWVTNSQVESIGGSNLPEKSNFQNHRGLDAMTGKGNFDISESMLLKMLDWVEKYGVIMAQLCKTSVARKVLLEAWKRLGAGFTAAIYRFDAARVFDVSVDACLLLLQPQRNSAGMDCPIYPGLQAETSEAVIGFRDGHLIANVSSYERWKHLTGRSAVKWRSGVKHDCANVMQLRRHKPHYLNGLGEKVDLEDAYLFPMLKGSELAAGKTENPKHVMIVTQRGIGENTSHIQEKAPRTWEYLLRHTAVLDQRRSSIYLKRPRFSVFGVGPYTFSQYKVGICGLYKHLRFRRIGPFLGKPVVLDDTCYFAPCATDEDADFIWTLMNSDVAQEVLSAFVFWDSKRPITVGLLEKLNLEALARELNLLGKMRAYLTRHAEIEAKAIVRRRRQTQGTLIDL
jgi:hypothetical protein